MCKKNDINKILDELIIIYKEIYKNDICHIYLYGSYARGDFSSDSDIDIVAIVKGDRKDLQERLIEIDMDRYYKVNKILKHHIEIRHIRGGESTKLRYSRT